MTDDQLIDLWLAGYASGVCSGLTSCGASETRAIEYAHAALKHLAD